MTRRLRRGVEAPYEFPNRPPAAAGEGDPNRSGPAPRKQGGGLPAGEVVPYPGGPVRWRKRPRLPSATHVRKMIKWAEFILRDLRSVRQIEP